MDWRKLFYTVVVIGVVSYWVSLSGQPLVLFLKGRIFDAIAYLVLPSILAMLVVRYGFGSWYGAFVLLAMTFLNLSVVYTYFILQGGMERTETYIFEYGNQSREISVHLPIVWQQQRLVYGISFF